MRKIIYILFIAVFSICGQIAKAQVFTQYGKTVTYNGRNPKTPYVNPVSIRCSGAGSTTNNSQGNFVLKFNNAKAGNVVNSFDVEIGDKKYVWFNRNYATQWVLTTEKTLCIELCDIQRIEHLKKTYRDVYVPRLKAKYEKAKKSLLQEERQNEKLKKDLHLLEEKYKQEINNIKLRSIEYAYVDESLLDSLDYLKRQYELNGDIEGAIRIGNEIDYKRQLNSISENQRKSNQRAIDDDRKLYIYTKSATQHILNCEAIGLESDSIMPYYEIVIPCYQQLLELYDPNNMEGRRCTEDFFESLKAEYGKILYKYYEHNGDEKFLSVACQCDNVDALWEKANNLKTDFEEAKNIYLKLIEICDKKGLMPLNIKRTDIIEMYESFPDFGVSFNGDSIYCHIITDNTVSICFYKRQKKNNVDIEIPKQIYNNGIKYEVRKIGRCAFIADSYFCYSIGIFHKGSKYLNDFQSLFKDDDGTFIGIPEKGFTLDSINSFKLPNSVTYIGDYAFACYYFPSKREISNIPKSIEYIGDGVFWGCSFENNVIKLPNRIKHIGDFYFGTGTEVEDISDIAITLYIPESLKEIDAYYGFQRFSPYIDKIIVDKRNRYFKVYNNMLYSYDNSRIYWGTVPKSKPTTLYIPKELEITVDDINSAQGYSYIPMLESIKNIEVEEGNPVCVLFKGNLFNKREGSLLLSPLGMDVFEVPNYYKMCSDAIEHSSINEIKIQIDSLTTIEWNEFIDKLPTIRDSIAMVINGNRTILVLGEYGEYKKTNFANILSEAKRSQPTLPVSYESIGKLYLQDNNIFGLFDMLCDMIRTRCDTLKIYNNYTHSLWTLYADLESSITKGGTLYTKQNYKEAYKEYEKVRKYMRYSPSLFDYVYYSNKCAVCMSYMERASDYYIRHIYDEILPMMEKLYAVQNTDNYKRWLAQLYRNASTCYLKDSEDLAIAENYIKKAIGLISDNLEYRDRSGCIYVELDKKEKAQKTLDEMYQLFLREDVEKTDLFIYLQKQKPSVK